MFRSKLMALALVGMMSAIAAAQVAPTQPPPTQPVQPTQPQRQPAQADQQQNLLGNSALSELLRTQIARLANLAQQVDLTEQQQEQMKNVLQQHQDLIVKHVENVWQHRSELRQAVLAEQPDEQTIRKHANELGKAIGDASVFAAQMKERVEPILTDQQRIALRQYMDNTDKDVQKFFSNIGKGQAGRAATLEGPTTR